MSDKPNLLIVNHFHAETVARLDSLYHSHHLWELTEQEQLRLITDLDGKCQAAASACWTCDELVYQLDSLQVLACYGVGVDAIDFDLANRHHIRVTNTPGVLDDAVADVALALILATTRNLIRADSFVRRKQWPQGPFPIATDLANKTLGIVGLGRIGEAIVQRALPFKLKLAYHNRTPKQLPYSYFPSISELAANSDILLCVLPGGAATSNIIDAQVFDALGPDGVFINVGRGSSVDQAALITALTKGQIAGAGLDVYSDEPCVPEQLLSMDNVVLLPHIGSATLETQRAMGALVIRNLQAFFDGEPLLSEVTQS